MNEWMNDLTDPKILNSSLLFVLILNTIIMV